MQQRLWSTHLPDGTEIAYATCGHGPPLVYVAGWLTHLELSWAIPQERRFYEALGEGRTLIRYDKPGCGLSAATNMPPSLDLELLTLATVVAAVGAERYDLLGTSFGSVVAAAWAAKHDDVTRLVLYGGWASGEAIASKPVQQHVLGIVATEWGLGSDLLADIFAPEADRPTRAAFTRYQREAASATTARDMLAVCYQVDIRPDLPRIIAPTLVLHREQDRAAPVEQARLLAAGIADATLRVLDGRSHLPFIGDVDALTSEIRRFLGLSSLRRRNSPSLTPRQREVAALVADGLSNRAIGGRLSITERSAESHVERICTRLGFRSRAQIAAWYVATTE